MKISQSYIRRLLADEENAAGALGHLSNFWSTRAKLSEAGELTGLSDVERLAHLALWYFGEVGNGGHIQYFMNPVGSFAQETVASLQQLGLEHAAKILHNAIQVFPGGQVPKERTVRLAEIDGLGRRQLDSLHQADLALWAITKRIDVDILRYLQQHQDEVLSAEQS